MKRLIALLLASALLLCSCSLSHKDSAAPASKKEQQAASNTAPSGSDSDPAPQKNPPSDKKPSTSNSGKNEPPKKGDKNTSISFSEALPIAMEKAKYGNFDRKLTDSERKALTVYLAEENYYYLKAQEDGTIGRLKESGSKDYVLEIHAFSTTAYLGRNLFANLPFGTLSERTTAQEPKELENPYFYLRILKKEIKKTSNYLENFSISNVLPDGAASATVELGAKPLSKKQIQELVAHFFRMPEITWVEFSYQVKDQSKNLEKRDASWEKQKKLSFDQAKSIIAEKVQKRPDQQLSQKEKMAFYQINTIIIEQEYAGKYTPYFDLSIYGTAKSKGIRVVDVCGIESLPLYSLLPYFENTSGTISKRSGSNTSCSLPTSSALSNKDREELFAQFSYSSSFGFCKIDYPDVAKKDMLDLVRHLIGFDFISAVCVENADGFGFFNDPHPGMDRMDNYFLRGYGPNDAYTPHLGYTVSEAKALEIAKSFIKTHYRESILQQYSHITKEGRTLIFKYKMGEENFVTLGTIKITLSADGAVESCRATDRSYQFNASDLNGLTRAKVLKVIQKDYEKNYKEKGATIEYGEAQLYHGYPEEWCLEITLRTKDQSGAYKNEHLYRYDLDARTCRRISVNKID